MVHHKPHLEVTGGSYAGSCARELPRRRAGNCSNGQHREVVERAWARCKQRAGLTERELAAKQGREVSRFGGGRQKVGHGPKTAARYLHGVSTHIPPSDNMGRSKGQAPGDKPLWRDLARPPLTWRLVSSIRRRSCSISSCAFCPFQICDIVYGRVPKYLWPTCHLLSKVPIPDPWHSTNPTLVRRS